MVLNFLGILQECTSSKESAIYALIKVIIDKSRGEVSLLEQDSIENVSKPIKNIYIFSFILCNFLVRMLQCF